LAAKLHQDHLTGSRDIQNGWILNGQAPTSSNLFPKIHGAAKPMMWDFPEGTSSIGTWHELHCKNWLVCLLRRLYSTWYCLVLLMISQKKN